MKTIRLITCDNLSEAYLIKDRLINEGIDCFVTNENFTNLMPIYNGMMGAGIQIMVKEIDLDNARKIINDKLNPSKTNLTCPNCNSDQIKIGIGKNKNLILTNIFLTILTAIPFGNIKPKYFCKSCQQEF